METAFSVQGDHYQQLAERVAIGDYQAESQLFCDLKIIEKIGVMIRRRLTLCEDDRKDLEIEVASAFLIYLRKGRYNPLKGCLMSCLWGITHNKVKDYLKRKKRIRTNEFPVNIAVYQMAGHLEARELREAMQHSLTLLDEKYHLVLVMRYYESFSIIEIADLLDITVSQVYNRIHYALRLLTNVL